MLFKKLLAYLHVSRWVVLVGISILITALIFLIKNSFKIPLSGKVAPPLIPLNLQRKVEEAQEQALKSRIEATSLALEQKKQLEQITTIQDGIERRKQLAALLNSL